MNLEINLIIKMKDYFDIQFKTIRPYNSYLASQLKWAEEHLKKYLLNQTITFWKCCPKLYQKLDKTYNWIVSNAIQELMVNGKN